MRRTGVITPWRPHRVRIASDELEGPLRHTTLGDGGEQVIDPLKPSGIDEDRLPHAGFERASGVARAGDPTGS
jgi:hypothetical protein